ncbi:MAG: DUF1638 domain-containing protein [Synergistaceae bacterium]|nr:DUF1638 domain-containing protein [Synergistaceae bacterium]
MTSKILACETLRDELEYAIEITGKAYEVVWLESGLHNYPDKLRAQMQGALDTFVNCDQVLMAFGCCGNSVIGLKTGDYQLIIPRVDDCISLLVGSVKKRMTYEKTYFLTRGWLRGERNLWVEYKYSVDKFGEEMADMLMESMLRNYKFLGILDTKCYGINEIMPEITRITRALKLNRIIIPASVEYLLDLLSGPWGKERFITVPKNSVVVDFRLFD